MTDSTTSFACRPQRSHLLGWVQTVGEHVRALPEWRDHPYKIFVEVKTPSEWGRVRADSTHRLQPSSSPGLRLPQLSPPSRTQSRVAAARNRKGSVGTIGPRLVAPPSSTGSPLADLLQASGTGAGTGSTAGGFLNQKPPEVMTLAAFTKSFTDRTWTDVTACASESGVWVKPSHLDPGHVPAKYARVVAPPPYVVLHASLC